MAAVSRVGLCALLLLVHGVQAAQVTPMEKVITLLKGLSSKVEAEGKKEAAQYDKYACFCKEQADDKLYSIEKSDEKIASLNAEIKELDTSIAQLNSDVGALSKKISGLAADIKTRTDKRNKDHDEYLVKAKDMNEAIDACGAAIEALRNSKLAMKNAKTSGFLEVQKATTALISTLSQPMLMTPGTVALIAELKSGKGAPKFQYQSNEILATIEDLQARFKSMKKDLDMGEFEVNSAFESTKLGLSNEKTFAEKEKGEKEALAEGKTEQVNTARSEKDSETNDRDLDQTFLDDLTKDCESKAVLFDDRSKVRSNELTALEEATEELKKGAAPNYSANKKLSGIQKGALLPKKRIVGIAVKMVVKKAAILPVSFLQEEQDGAGKQVVVDKVLALLNGAAGRTGSAALASAAMRVKMAEDHFVKVRALIKDLISKLAADAKSEATQKGFCDTSMAKAVSDRDEASAKIEMANAKITTLTAKQNSLEDDISTLQKDVAALQKGLLEATELRAEDKADNAKTETMSDEAIKSCELALQVLQKFYGSLVQTHKYTPPKADRDGNTVGDLAPEVFDDKYAGSKSESKGIVGILEVILSDFERTNKKTKTEDGESQAAFEQFEKETKADVAQKKKTVKAKEGEVSDAKSDIIDQQQALMDAKELHESGTTALADLENMCVKGEETWEERKKKREDEVEALKDAMDILDNWQN